MDNHSIKTGFCFGLVSGIITTLGLMVGLHSGTLSRIAVLGGIITIAVADAFSDALGIHISEESEGVHTEKQIWESTLATFVAKFFFAFTFVGIVLLFQPLSKAIIISIIWGITALTVLSYMIAKSRKQKTWKVIAEHLIIIVTVIIATHFLGEWIRAIFV